MPQYDIAIIGSGPCGYVAGIRVAQLGARVCLIEKDKIGGTCLNYGCIPTKAMAFSANLFSSAKDFNAFGITAQNLDFDFGKFRERKEEVVKRLRSGVEFLLKSRKVETTFAQAQLLDRDTIKAGEEIVRAKYILIATGSVPVELKAFPFDKRLILSSTDLLNLDRVPESLTIIGGGVIGCEFASLFNILGTKVKIVELLNQLLPTEDIEVARFLEALFRKRGIEIFLGSSASAFRKVGNSLAIELSDGTELISENLVVCVGRLPATAGLGLERLNIKLNRGYIVVDEDYNTGLQGVFAAGDVIGKAMLAHAASKEGVVVAEYLFGKKFKINYNAIPNCIYTKPEIASVGLTQKKAEEDSISVEVRKFRFQSLGRSHISGEIDGFIKLVVEKETDKIIGCQIIGPHATDIIGEMCLAIELGITSERLASIIHAHPTFSEIIGEVAEMVRGKAIHSINEIKG